MAQSHSAYELGEMAQLSRQIKAECISRCLIEDQKVPVRVLAILIFFKPLTLVLRSPEFWYIAKALLFNMNKNETINF